MTHRVTTDHRCRSQRTEEDEASDAGITEEYECTDAELKEAGFHVVDPSEAEFGAGPAGAGLGEVIELFDIPPRPPRAA